MGLSEHAELVLYHHPFTRAATVVGMLEETGEDYRLAYLDIQKGEHKGEVLTRLNKMGKVPTLVDGEQVITESAAIGLYLADRYAPDRLAPALDDKARGTYLRWSLFAPTVVETAAYARSAKWDYRPGQAGWGTYEDMLDACSAAVLADPSGPWLLGERFTMADIIFGGTVRNMLQFNMLDKRDELVAYADALSARPSMVRAADINAKIKSDRGL